MKWGMPVRYQTAFLAKQRRSEAVWTFDIILATAHRTFRSRWSTLHFQQCMEEFAPELKPLLHDILHLGLVGFIRNICDTCI